MTTPAPNSPAVSPYGLGLPITVWAVNLGTARQLISGAGFLYAVSVTCKASTSSSLVYLYDGTDTTGNLIGCFGAPAGATVVECPGFPGIPFKNGVYCSNLGVGANVVISYIRADRIP